MNVLFIGASSVGPRWIMSILKKNRHNTYGIYVGYKDIMVGEEAAPFLPPIDESFLNAKKINVVGLTVDSLNIDKAIQISSEIKRGYPNIKIIWGGIHPTVEPEECINYSKVDYLCLGEGEYPMLELCDALEAINNGKQASDIRIKNIWVRKENKVFKNELREYVDINTVDFDRDDVLYNGIYTSRGCAGNCTFCMSPYIKTKLGIKGNYFRNRDVRLVINEIYEMIRSNNKFLLNKIIHSKTLLGKLKALRRLYLYNTEPIRIKDDSFLLNKKWFFEFTEELSKRFRRRGYICSALVSDINERVVRALKKGNCKMIILGFESGDENYRNNVLNKHVTDAQIYEAMRLLRKAGIPVLGQWMIGMPGETPTQAIKSIKMSMEIKDIPQIHIATPFPKTHMKELAIELGYLSANTKISVQSIYQDFTMVPEDQLNTFRLLYNIFKVNNQELRNSRQNIFDRFYNEIKQFGNKKIGEILLKDIK